MWYVFMILTVLVYVRAFYGLLFDALLVFIGFVNARVSCVNRMQSTMLFWGAGARSTNDISIKFEIRPNFAVLWIKMYSSNHNRILHTSRDVCKISLCSVNHISN